MPALLRQALPWLAAFGAVLALLLAAALPVRLRAIDPAVVAASGAGTRGLRDAGDDALAEARTGTLARLWELAPPGHGGDGLRRDRLALLAERPALALVGRPAPYAQSVLELAGVVLPVPPPALPPPALELLRPAAVRREGAAMLGASPVPIVGELLAARSIPGLARFPAKDAPGGAVTDGVLVFAALLAQEGALPTTLQRALRREVAQASAGGPGAAEAWEKTLDALLALGRRLDLGSAADLLAGTVDTRDLHAVASALRADARHADLLVAVAELGLPSGEAARYLGRHGARGTEGLAVAARAGEGAVRLLLDRDLPPAEVTPLARPLRRLGESLAPAVATWPASLGLAAKATTILAAALLGFAALRPVARAAAGPGLGDSGRKFARGSFAAALLLAAAILAEPDLFPPPPPASPPEFRLVAEALASVSPRAVSAMSIDQLTLVAVLVFFVIQLGIFLLGLAKLGQIRRLDAPPALKLKLVENEEHLFDFGLYVGLIGTATSFIMLSLGIIEASIMAAYTSTLFGIVFVAILKVTQVRPYRRSLLLAAARDAAQGSPS